MGRGRCLALDRDDRHGRDRERRRDIDLDAGHLVATAVAADISHVQCHRDRHADRGNERRPGERPEPRRERDAREQTDEQDGKDRSRGARACRADRHATRGVHRAGVDDDPGSGASSAVSIPSTNALTRRRVELASRPRPRAGAAPPGRRAPCGTAASSSSPRTRRRPRGSGRSAGCPRRRAGRGSRRRPSARGGGGCRPGSASTSGRSRTIRSPSATCCLTTAYSSSVSLPGLRRIASGMPILPTSWSSPAIRIVATSSASRPRAAGRGRRRSGRRPRSGASCSGPSCRRRWTRPWRTSNAGDRRAPRRPSAGDADRVAAARLRLLERPGRGREEHGHGVAVLRDTCRCAALIVIGRRSVRLELEG